MLKPRIGLLCTNLQRANKIKKCVKSIEDVDFLFDCRSNKNLQFHLKENKVNLLIIDFTNALILGKSLSNLNTSNCKILLVTNTSPDNMLIPASFFMFSIVDIADIKTCVELAITCTITGQHFFSSSIHSILNAATDFLIPPRALGLTSIHIKVLNSYLEGGTLNEMADRIHLSPSTVKKHLNTIKQKLNLDSNNHIIDFLRKHHWCDFKTGKLIFH